MLLPSEINDLILDSSAKEGKAEKKKSWPVHQILDQYYRQCCCSIPDCLDHNKSNQDGWEVRFVYSRRRANVISVQQHLNVFSVLLILAPLSRNVSQSPQMTRTSSDIWPEVTRTVFPPLCPDSTLDVFFLRADDRNSSRAAGKPILADSIKLSSSHSGMLLSFSLQVTEYTVSCTGIKVEPLIEWWYRWREEEKPNLARRSAVATYSPALR